LGIAGKIGLTLGGAGIGIGVEYGLFGWGLPYVVMIGISSLYKK
jgi:hypothetical protein